MRFGSLLCVIFVIFLPHVTKAMDVQGLDTALTSLSNIDRKTNKPLVETLKKAGGAGEILSVTALRGACSTRIAEGVSNHLEFLVVSKDDVYPIRIIYFVYQSRPNLQLQYQGIKTDMGEWPQGRLDDASGYRRLLDKRKFIARIADAYLEAWSDLKSVRPYEDMDPGIASRGFDPKNLVKLSYSFTDRKYDNSIYWRGAPDRDNGLSRRNPPNWYYEIYLKGLVDSKGDQRVSYDVVGLDIRMPTSQQNPFLTTNAAARKVAKK
jgi:hypothetical protein